MNFSLFKVSGRLLVVLMLVGALVMSSWAQSVSAEPKFEVYNNLNQASGLSHVPGEVLYRYNNDTEHFRVKKVPNVEQAIAAMKKNPKIEYVEPNYIAYADFAPNDQYYAGYQWNLQDGSNGINMEQAWDLSTGVDAVGSSTIVAVIDTGVAYEDYSVTALRGRKTIIVERYTQAPDLAETCFVNGYDFINNDAHPNDDAGHGTHVAGTIAQSTNNNGVGVAGIAFNACIMPLKALAANGSGPYDVIADAVIYAVDNGAHVINMSLGGTYDSVTLRNAIAYAYNNDVTVVAAAGNDTLDSADVPHYPSSYNDHVISVGATGFDGVRASYSNYGNDIDIAAPGGDDEDLNGDGYIDGILQQTFGSDINQFGYSFYTGTSMASPHVAGVAALLVAKGNATTPDEIREALETTAQDIGGQQIGSGLLDAYGALNWVVGPVVPVDPEANAGPDQTVMTANGEVFALVTLDGGASTDADGSIDSYKWTEGSLLLGSTEVLTVDFSIGIHYISLEVTDDSGATSVDDVLIEVTGYINQGPTADAGVDQPFDVPAGQSVTVFLSGSGSDDPEGDTLTYEWTGGDIAGSVAGVEYTTDLSAGTYVFTLTVDDGESVSTDDVSVTVNEIVESDISLSIVKRKVRGRMNADLTWSGAVTTNVEVYRNGSLIITTDNDGVHTDNIGKGGGSFSYEVCETGGGTCSSEVTVTF